MHVRNPCFVAILVTIQAVLAVPRPEAPLPSEDKESGVNPWLLALGSPALAVPFLLPRPDPCITEALKIRAKNIEMFNKNIKHASHELWPEWYTTLTEVVSGCEARYRQQGKAKKIDLTKPVYRDILEEGLARCIKEERCKNASRFTGVQDEWWDEKQCIRRCEMWWKLDPVPEPKMDRRPDARDRLDSVIQQAGDKLNYFVAAIAKVDSHATQGSKPSAGGSMFLGGMTGKAPAFAPW